MAKKIRKHIVKNVLLKKPVPKEELTTWNGNIPLNIAKYDRISFSVLINKRREVRKIENISYDILIDDRWVNVLRYDDHGGIGLLHKHTKVAINDTREIESSEGIKRSPNKQTQFRWAFKDIKRNYLNYRTKFLKNSNIDLY